MFYYVQRRENRDTLTNSERVRKKKKKKQRIKRRRSSPFSPFARDAHQQKQSSPSAEWAFFSVSGGAHRLHTRNAQSAATDGGLRALTDQKEAKGEAGTRLAKLACQLGSPKSTALCTAHPQPATAQSQRAQKRNGSTHGALPSFLG